MQPLKFAVLMQISVNPEEMRAQFKPLEVNGKPTNRNQKCFASM